MTEVKDRLEAIAQSLGRHAAEALRVVSDAAAKLAQSGAAEHAGDQRPQSSGDHGGTHAGASAAVWPILGASAIMALGLAIGLQSSDSSRTAISEMKEQIHAMTARIDSVEATAAASRTAVTALDHRFAAAETAANLNLAETKKALSVQPAAQSPKAGEAASQLPDLAPLEQRLRVLEAKLNPHAEATGSTETHGGGTEHAPGAFPPFDSANFSPLIIWLVLSFGLLYLLMSKIALPQVEGILHARAGKIRDDLKEAHAFREKSQEAAAAHEKTIADARAKAQTLANETQVRLHAETEAKRQALEADLNAKLAAAETQIAETKAKAMGNVDDIARDAAAAIVQHITGKAADPKAVAAAVASEKV